MEWLIIILVVVVLVVLFFMFGGTIDLSAKEEPEKDYVMIPKPMEDKEYTTPPENAFTEETRETVLSSVRRMIEHGEEVDVTFVQPYTPESLTAQALRYEALARTSYTSTGYH